MKPKLHCPACESELQWGAKFCASCGNPVEWPESLSASSQPEQSSKGGVTCKMCGAENGFDVKFCVACGAELAGGGKQQAKKEKGMSQKGKQTTKGMVPSPLASSWKTIAGFIVFVVAGVLILEFTTNRKQLPQAQQAQQAEQPAGANMQAVSQIEEMEKQVTANLNDLQGMVKLANFLQDNRFFDKAIKYYGKYLEKNPKDTDARVDLGICYYDLGNLDEAQKQMELALKNDSKHQMAHLNLGIVNLRAGKVKEANEWFKKAVELGPNTGAGQRAQQFLNQHSNSQNLQIN